jgi:hypothetical protein
MTRKTVMGFAGVVLAAAGIVGATRAGDFRQATWGMTMEEVKKTEARATALESLPDSGAGPAPSDLSYQGMLIGKYRMKILYHFEKGKLVRCVYSLSGTLRPSDYDTLGKILAAKHGKPVSVSPLNPFGERETTWQNKRTEIDLLEKRDGTTSRRGSADKRADGTPATSLEINYYSVDWGRKDVAEYKKEVKEDQESDAVIRDVIEDWYEVAPGVWEWDEM